MLWLNGERLSERQGRHISVADEIEVPIQLQAGWNRVLLGPAMRLVGTPRDVTDTLRGSIEELARVRPAVR